MPARLLLTCLLTALLAGCGIKGPLYLPADHGPDSAGQADHSKAPPADPQ